MKKLLLLGASAFMLIGCGAQGPKEITPEKYGEMIAKLPKSEEIDWNISYKHASGDFFHSETGKADKKGIATFTYKEDVSGADYVEDTDSEFNNDVRQSLGTIANDAYKNYLDYITPRDKAEKREFKFYDNLTYKTSLSYQNEDAFKPGVMHSVTVTETFYYDSQGVLIKFDYLLKDVSSESITKDIHEITNITYSK